MNGIQYIDMGEKLLSLVKKSGRINPKNKRLELSLNSDEVYNLAKNNDMVNGEYFFGKGIYSNFDWNLDLAYKAKPNYEVLSVNLTKDGCDSLRGAISKSKTKKGEIKKYHFTDNDILLQTGSTSKSGKIKQPQKKEVFPEKLLGYLWPLEERSLIVLSDLYGIVGDAKPVEQVAKEWNLTPTRIKEIKRHAVWSTLSRYQERSCNKLTETDAHQYSIQEYIKALKQARNNKSYKYLEDLRNFPEYTARHYPDRVVDDAFLAEIQEARQLHDVINEWKYAKKINRKKN